MECGKQRGAVDTVRTIVTHNNHSFYIVLSRTIHNRPKSLVGDKILSTKVITEPTWYGVITSQRRFQTLNISYPYIDTHILWVQVRYEKYGTYYKINLIAFV